MKRTRITPDQLRGLADYLKTQPNLPIPWVDAIQEIAYLNPSLLPEQKIRRYTEIAETALKRMGCGSPPARAASRAPRRDNVSEDERLPEAALEEKVE